MLLLNHINIAFQSTFVHSVYFGLFSLCRSISIHLGLFVYFGPFSRFRSISLHFGPFQCTSVHLVHSVHFVLFRLVRSTLVHSVHFVDVSSLRIEGNIQYIYIVQSKYTCQVTTSSLILLVEFLLIYSQLDDWDKLQNRFYNFWHVFTSL